MRILDNLWFIQDTFQIGVVILDKLINDLKAKLPLKKKVSDEEIEETDESSNENSELTDSSIDSDRTDMTDLNELEGFETHDKPQTFIDKIKAKIVPPKKSSKKSDEGEADKTKNAGGKRKVNPIVIVAVIVGLVIWLLPDEEEPLPEVPVVASYKKPNRKKVKPNTEQAPAEGTPAPEATVAPTDAPVTEPAVSDPTVAEPTVAEPTVAEPTVAEPTVAEPTVAEPTVAEPTVAEPTVAEPTVAEPTVAEPTVAEPTVTEPTPEEPSITAEAGTDNVGGETSTSTDSVEGQNAQVPSEADVTDKILEDLEKQVKKEQPKEVKKEYVTPPDYEYKGRGLVYNCTGKHWACVDAPSYKSCEDNFSSTGYLKKNKECYPFNVYETTKGCELMQNRVVSSNEKTEFCK